jgi:sulfotransferase family protein
MLKNPIIHIVGCSPRSGTTLFHEVMINSFEVQLSYPSEKSIFRGQVIGQGITVTKHPEEVFYMKCLLAIEPRLHVVYLSRDPRDVVSSVHKGNLSIGYFTGIKKWIEYQQEFEAIKGHPRVIEVKYKELVSQPDVVQEHLVKVCPFLIKKQSFSSYHKSANPSGSSLIAMNDLRPISTKSLGSWKNNLPRIKQQLSVCSELPDILIKYGYEESKGWLEILESVSCNEKNEGETKSIYSFKMQYRIFRKCSWYFLARLMLRLMGQVQ